MIQRKYLWSCFLALISVVVFAKFTSIGFGVSEEFVIGNATANDVSVAKRISSYYEAIVLFTLTFLIVYLLIRRFQVQIDQNKQLHTVDLLLHLGCLLAFLAIINEKLLDSMLLVLFFSGLIFLTGLLDRSKQSNFTPDTWLSVGLGFISGYFLFHSALIGGVVAITICALLLRFGLSHKLTRWTTFLLVSAPIIAFSGVETTIILNQRGIFLNSYFPITFGVGILFCILFYWRDQQKKWTTQQFLYRILTPICLIGNVLIQHYSPIIKQPDEFFETANLLNPVMQFVKFDELPIVDNLSSHLVSDFFWTGLYSSLNGYQAEASTLIYFEFSVIFYMLVTYYFLQSVVGNKPWIVVALFLVPATLYILPNYYSLILLPYTSLFRYFKYNKTNYFYRFFIAVIAICFWRLDLGISLICSVLMFIPCWIYCRKGELPRLLRWILIAGILGTGIAVTFIVLIPHQFSQMIGYFGANQAHAYSEITVVKNNIFFVNYLILPLTVVLIAIHSLISYKQTTLKAETLLLILLSFFYFFNLQRGLVRHSFVEQNDIQIASFGWLIIAIKAWIWKESTLSRNQSTLFIALALCLIPCVFSYNALKGTENFFQKEMRFGLRHLPKLTNERIKRVEKDPAVDERNAELLSFLQTYLKPNETFLDFTNSPTLYFYAEKNIPSYFNQYLQNTVTDQLQYENLTDLKKHRVPIVLFSHANEHPFDNIDNIPNRVRHHILTQFIYDNYEPFAQIGEYRIWKEKGWNCKYIPAKSYPKLDEKWSLGLLPYFWKPDKQAVFSPSNDSKISYNDSLFRFSLVQKLDANEFLKLELHSDVEQSYYLSAPGFQMDFQVKKGQSHYYIPIGCSENLQTDSVQIQTYLPISPVAIKNLEIVRLIKK